MLPTRQEEWQQFCVTFLPIWKEYLRTHQTTIEDVELAVVLTGITTMPAIQELGGVLKTVRVPLTLIMANIDDAEALAREMAAYAQTQGDYAKAQGDRLDIDEVVTNAIAATSSANEKAAYAKTQGDYAKEQGDYALDKGGYANTQGTYAKNQGDYAKEQGDYAKAQGTSANSIYTTVNSWFSGNGGFKATAEAWIAAAKAAWSSWFGTSEDTGVQGTWKTWFNARKAEIAQKLQDIETAISNADDKASYAEAQGDYAKAMGRVADNSATSASTQADRAAASAELARGEAQNLGAIKEDCLDATGAALTAAQKAGEKITEVDALVKTISGEGSAAPARMTVSVLGTISTKNKELQRIGVKLFPTYVMQNVLYQKVSGSSVMVNPSGVITITGTGESVFWIIPPQNTELWQQVSVNVRGPRIRLSRSGKMRLNSGRIRIV